MTEITTARATAHAHLGACEGEHTKACDMLTVEIGELFREVTGLRAALTVAREALERMRADARHALARIAALTEVTK